MGVKPKDINMFKRIASPLLSEKKEILGDKFIIKTKL